jgi:hypothetical protein
MVYGSFYNLNVIIETGWRDNLLELYIVNRKTFKPIFYLDLRKKEELVEPEKTDLEKVEFFSGGLIGIDEIMKEISESQSRGIKEVSLIEHKGKIMMMEHTPDVIICFLTNKQLNSLRYYLRSIRDMWEKYYSKQILNWNEVDSEIFLSINNCVQRILEDPTGEENKVEHR